jgi:hypothetical protein
MAKNNLRTVHVGEQTWKYVVDAKEIRIYEPGTKQIRVRIPTNPMQKASVLPGLVKDYIEKNLLKTQEK